MALTLAQYRTRIVQVLMDTANAIWATASIDEGLKSALDEYSSVSPLTMETVIIAPAAGREIALDAISGLDCVVEVWFPYDSTAAEVFPPNRVSGFSLMWDDARPVLYLNSVKTEQPQANDELRIFYTKKHTIQDLDSASVTTVALLSESLLCLGAAGFCALQRATDLNETAGNMTSSTPNYGALAAMLLEEFRNGIYKRKMDSVGTVAFGDGWALDKWDK